jgi:hypothetical protein
VWEWCARQSLLAVEQRANGSHNRDNDGSNQGTEENSLGHTSQRPVFLLWHRSYVGFIESDKL